MTRLRRQMKLLMLMNEDGDDNEIRSTVEHQELVLEPAS